MSLKSSRPVPDTEAYQFIVDNINGNSLYKENLPEDFCFPCKSAIAVLIASSAKTLQCILTGGKASSSAMSVFLISVCHLLYPLLFLS